MISHKNAGRVPKNFQITIVKVLVLLFVLYVGWVFIRTLSQSLIFKSPDRVNLMFYGTGGQFLSLGFTDSVNYFASFDPGLSVYVPGGYGAYDLYAVPGLSQLEKKPEIMTHTFSSLTSTYVDFYLPLRLHTADNLPFLSLKDVIFMKDTNTNIFDRMVLYGALLNKRKGDFSLLSTHVVLNGDAYESAFYNKYVGFFYRKSLRNEGENVQLLYNSSTAAKVLARVLDGDGIHVVDLSQDNNPIDHCIVTKNTSNHTLTEDYLRERFGCITVEGDTGGQDFIIRFGTGVEHQWQ